MKDYTDFVLASASYPRRHHFIAGLTYALLALGGEAGEAQNVLKKVIRDEDSQLSWERREQLLLELGDVLWYLTAAADELGATLQEVAAINIEKLTKRRLERGRVC